MHAQDIILNPVPQDVHKGMAAEFCDDGKGHEGLFVIAGGDKGCCDTPIEQKRNHEAPVRCHI